MSGLPGATAALAAGLLLCFCWPALLVVPLSPSAAALARVAEGTAERAELQLHPAVSGALLGENGAVLGEDVVSTFTTALRRGQETGHSRSRPCRIRTGHCCPVLS